MVNKMNEKKNTTHIIYNNAHMHICTYTVHKYTHIHQQKTLYTD